MTDSRSGGVPEAGHVDVGERAEPDALSPEAAEESHPPEKARRRRRRRGEAAGLRTGPGGRRTYTHRAALRIGAVALAALVFILWGQPAVTVVVVSAVLLLVVLGLIEWIGQPPPHPGPTAPPPGG